MKNSFILYTDYMEHLRLLNMEQRGVLLTALMHYQHGDDLPEMDPITYMAFSFIKQDMDTNNEKYMRIVERNQENGKKGGRPKNPKNPNGFSENPKKPKKADNDNDNENDNVNDNDNVKDKDKINYQLIADLYNSTCVSFPRVTALSDARKKAIKARLNVYSIDDFKRLFEKAEASNFLKGQNDRNWTANFDWLIKDGNMAKVLDGNYDNKDKQKSVQGENKAAAELNQFYNMAASWADED